MSVPVLTFFNNKGVVGKTSLVYHLAWMFTELDWRILVLDLDPQANLTAAFLDEDQLESLWEGSSGPSTIYRAVEPLAEMGDLQEPRPLNIVPGLHLVPGDVALAGFEELLSSERPNCMRDQQLRRPFRVVSAFWQVAQLAARRVEAEIILADVGPNLGAINRSALIASDHVVIPLGADLFSLQGLKNLGPTLRSWRSLWHRRLENWPDADLELPAGRMKPLGYVIQQYGVRLSRPVKAYDRWVNRVPAVYAQSVLEQANTAETPATDANCLLTIKHYRSLVPMAQEARQPIFKLTPADGAIGNHAVAAREAYTDFRWLATRVLKGMGLEKDLLEPPRKAAAVHA